MSEWISVKDRLPDDEIQRNIGVLVLFDDGFMATTSFVNGEWELWDDAGEITHWQPLPEPPERKTKVIEWHLNTGFSGCTHHGEIEVDINATEEEIEEEVKEYAFQLLDLYWEEKKGD